MAHQHISEQIIATRKKEHEKKIEAIIESLVEGYPDENAEDPNISDPSLDIYKIHGFSWDQVLRILRIEEENNDNDDDVSMVLSYLLKYPKLRGLSKVIRSAYSEEKEHLYWRIKQFVLDFRYRDPRNIAPSLPRNTWWYQIHTRCPKAMDIIQGYTGEYDVDSLWWD